MNGASNEWCVPGHGARRIDASFRRPRVLRAEIFAAHDVRLRFPRAAASAAEREREPRVALLWRSYTGGGNTDVAPPQGTGGASTRRYALPVSVGHAHTSRTIPALVHISLLADARRWGGGGWSLRHTAHSMDLLYA